GGGDEREEDSADSRGAGGLLYGSTDDSIFSLSESGSHRDLKINPKNEERGERVRPNCNEDGRKKKCRRRSSSERGEKTATDEVGVMRGVIGVVEMCKIN
ncbi:hypothetical protein GWI33_011578, partial [Rhynchophorus ferrugineus]